MRTQNVFGNRHSPSNIAKKFAVLQSLHWLSSGGHVDETNKYLQHHIIFNYYFVCIIDVVKDFHLCTIDLRYKHSLMVLQLKIHMKS